MSHDPFTIELYCRSCEQVELCGREHVRDKLLAIRKVSRKADPESAILLELLRANLPKLSCVHCSESNLFVRAAQESLDDDWGEIKVCTACKQPLSPERLEIFPNTTLCPNCQAADENG